MKPPITFETERMILRIPLVSDAQEIFDAYASDPEVARFMLWRVNKTVSEVEGFLKRCQAVWEHESGFPYVIILKETGQLIGMFEIHPAGHRIELGYVFARSQWGKGLASEVTRAVVAWGLAQAGIFRVQATCDTENGASARVLEKSGMVREAVLRRYSIRPALGDEPRDSYLYAVVK